MPRKGGVSKREVLPDPIYNSKLVTRLINRLMLDGKRGTASKILYEAFDIVKEKTGNEPLDVFEEAMKNIMPVLEVKARRVGGSNYQVPIEVRPDRRTTLGLKTQCRTTIRANFNRNLVVGTADTTCLNFQYRHDVLHCFFKDIQWFITCLFLNNIKCFV